jgi:hypothetical protein
MERAPEGVEVEREMTIRLDGPTGVYAPAGIFRGPLRRPVPFGVDLDLRGLVPPRRP